ncbi:EB1C [Symbiodinium natans]|uniref:EB1C protein n=1 Tax=Symbiodinium natans TaxID=878477 RepID=A0A812L9W9_9DINO|nr:EB1C [Symbiodinium natans]
MAWQEPLLAEFKSWYTDQEGFGGYLRHFLAHYGHFFREKQETHLFVYSKLHEEFRENLEKAVSAWLAAKGLAEWHLEAMLEYAQETGDVETSGIVNAMIRLLEYQTWIEYIFGLKESPEIQELLANQWHQPGWDRIGDSEVDWTIKQWEAWTDEEWHSWWASRQQWTDEEWEEWWQGQSHWRDDWWDDKSAQWTDKTWNTAGGYGQDAGAGYGLPAAPVAPADA